MSLHMQREMEHLKKQVLSLCAMVEEQVETAIRALLERDAELARMVERGDAEIDRREVEVEGRDLRLHGPVAQPGCPGRLTDIRLGQYP